MKEKVQENHEWPVDERGKERERNHNPEVDQGTISKGNEKKSL